MSDQDDLALGETDEGEEPFTFPPAERKVITQGYDLSVDTLVEQWGDGMLILPDLQREYVWDNARASRLIESLLLNIPIPILYFVETPEAKYEVIDGHQRVRSVVRYLSNEFRLAPLRVLRELSGMRFHQLPDREQRFLRTRVMRAIIISVDSHPLMKYEVFERLNTGSIALNAQEIRNALYHGRLNTLLRELENHESFRRCIGTKSPRKRMVDRELVLRFFAFHERVEEYRPPLVRFLNNYMHGAQAFSDADIEVRRQLFDRTLRRIEHVFGHAAFRMTDAHGEPTERQVNRALFDAQTVAFAGLENDPDPAQRELIRQSVANLYANEEFLDSIRRATGDRSRLARRIQAFVTTLTQAGLVVDVPALE